MGKKSRIKREFRSKFTAEERTAMKKEFREKRNKAESQMRYEPIEKNGRLLRFKMMWKDPERQKIADATKEQAKLKRRKLADAIMSIFTKNKKVS